jgi:hypothetical protein
MSNSQKPNLTTEEFEVRVWGFVVVVVTCILCFIVIALLYSVTFVTQPIKSMAPIDQAYTKMLNDIVLLIVGGIGGVMTKRAAGAVSRAFNPAQQSQPMCHTYQGQGVGFGMSNNSGYNPPSAYGGLPSQPFGAMPVFTNPQLDENWTPPPPPTTPPEHLESDAEREQIAIARTEAD